MNCWLCLNKFTHFHCKRWDGLHLSVWSNMTVKLYFITVYTLWSKVSYFTLVLKKWSKFSNNLSSSLCFDFKKKINIGTRKLVAVSQRRQRGCKTAFQGRWQRVHCEYRRELTPHNWQNWKRVFFSCYCNEIYRVEAVGLKTSNFLKNYNLYEYVKFWAISWEIDILPIIK